METESIPSHILATLRRATREAEDLELQAKTIERFVSKEAEPLNLQPGDRLDLSTGTITRAAKAEE